MILTAKENEMINENTRLTRDEMIDFILDVAEVDYDGAECWMQTLIDFSGVDEDEDEDYPDVEDGWIDDYVLAVAEILEKATDKEVAAEYEEALDTCERLKIDVDNFIKKNASNFVHKETTKTLLTPC